MGCFFFSTSDNGSAEKREPVSSVAPWWARCSGLVIPDSVLGDDLPPDQFSSNISNRLRLLSIPSAVASTIQYDILNAITTYCLVLRESGLKNFWSATDDLKLIAASLRISESSGSLSSTETFSSAVTAVEHAFYKDLPGDELRQVVKSDLGVILKNRDWRKDKDSIGRTHFGYLALCDVLTLFTKAKKIVQVPDKKQSYFRICKKLEFYLKWSECNEDCWMKLAEDLGGLT